MRRAVRLRRTCRIRTSRPPTSRASSTTSVSISRCRSAICAGSAWSLHGNLGYSTSNSEDVVTAILERMPATLLLMGCSFVFSLIIGVAFGIFAAVKPYSIGDYAVTTFAFFGQSMPVFWFALMMQLVFAVAGVTAFGYHFALPSAGISSSDTFDLGDRVQHLVLPVIVLSLLYIATWSRFTRSSMLEVIRTDYMRTAAAKGLGRLTIIFRHGLKNALIPVVTIIALSLPGLVAGAVVTETIFAWPGMGRLFFNALGPVRFLPADGLLDDGLVPRRVLQYSRRSRVCVARSARQV